MKETKVITLGVITTAALAIVVVTTIAVAGLHSQLIVQLTYAQTTSTIILGEQPFFEENGKITGQKPLGNNRIEISFSSNGTMKGNIDLTNTGKFWSVSKGGNVTYGQGQGVITTTKDGSSELANYTFLIIGNVTEEGKPVFRGSTVYNTAPSSSSDGKLAFLDNIITVFKGEIDKRGNFVSKEWEWK
jgi:hypothetical protein